MSQVLATVFQLQLVSILSLLFVGGIGAAEEGRKPAMTFRPAGEFAGESHDSVSPIIIGGDEKFVKEIPRQARSQPLDDRCLMGNMKNMEIKPSAKRKAKPDKRSIDQLSAVQSLSSAPGISECEQGDFVSDGAEQYSAVIPSLKVVVVRPAHPSAQLPQQEASTAGFVNSESDHGGQTIESSKDERISPPGAVAIDGIESKEPHGTRLIFPDGRTTGATWYTGDSTYFSAVYPVISEVVEPHIMRIKLRADLHDNENSEQYANGKISVYAIPASKDSSLLHQKDILMSIELWVYDNATKRIENLQEAINALARLDDVKEEILNHRLKSAFYQIASHVTRPDALQDIANIAMGRDSTTSQKALNEGMAGWVPDEHPDVRTYLAKRLEAKLGRIGIPRFCSYLNKGDEYQAQLEKLLGSNIFELTPPRRSDVILHNMAVRFRGDENRDHKKIPLGMIPPNQSTFAPAFTFDETVLSTEPDASIYSFIDTDALARRVGRLLELENTRGDTRDELDKFLTSESIVGSAKEGTSDEPEPIIRMVSRGEDDSLLLLEHGRWIPVTQESTEQDNVTVGLPAL